MSSATFTGGTDDKSYLHNVKRNTRRKKHVRVKEKISHISVPRLIRKCRNPVQITVYRSMSMSLQRYAHNRNNQTHLDLCLTPHPLSRMYQYSAESCQNKPLLCHRQISVFNGCTRSIPVHRATTVDIETIPRITKLFKNLGHVLLLTSSSSLVPESVACLHMQINLLI